MKTKEEQLKAKKEELRKYMIEYFNLIKETEVAKHISTENDEELILDAYTFATMHFIRSIAKIKGYIE